MPYSYPQPIDKSQAVRDIPHLIPGALLFAGTAGFINSIALGYFHAPVSHMSGAVSYLGIDLAQRRMGDVATSITVVLGFTVGAALAGFIIGAQKQGPGRRYAITLACEGMLLALAMVLLMKNRDFGIPLVAMACGLQNAMTSSYCGLGIRTTHVTGIVTDIGVMLGHWLHHRKIEHWKLSFMVATVTAFGMGVWIGALADKRFGPGSLAVTAVSCLVAGIFVWFFSEEKWLKA